MTGLRKRLILVTMLSQKLVRGQNVQIKKIAKPEVVTAKTSAIEMTSVAGETVTDVDVTAIVTATVDVDADHRTRLSLK
jgi:hypothetical protein|tara:strand:- start:443 stop:679 length:237 start_codon:yes stop_codon:yes gene_type:complete